MAIAPHTVVPPSTNPLVIWGDTNKLAAFVGPMTADTEVSPSLDLEDVKAHQRKRYPGDTTKVSVSQHDRAKLRGGELRGNALPGRNFYIEEPQVVNGKTVYDVTTFTFVGNFADVAQWLTANAIKEFRFRSPGGVPYDNGYTPV